MDRRLLAEARAARRAYAASILLQLGAGLCLVAYSYTLSRIIARAFLDRAQLDALAGLLALTAALALARAALTWGAQRAASGASIAVRLDLRKRLLTHIAALGPGYLHGERTGELAAAAVTGIDTLDGFLRDYLPAVAMAALLPAAILAVVFRLDLLTFAVLLVTAPLIPIFMLLIGKAAGALAQRHYGGLGLLSAHFLDVMQGLTTLKLLNRSRRQVETIARISDEFRSATMGVLRVAFLSALTLEMLATVSVAIVAVEIALRLLRGGMAFEQALFLLVIAPEFYQPLRTLGARFHAGADAAAAADRIFAVLDIPLPPRGGAAPPAQPAPVRFESVAFAYDGGERPALNGLSFEMGRGERVALVGSSGGGKSTAAALLLGFAAPSAGRILVGGVDLATVDPDAWRTQVAWVPQSPYLFNATVAENIRLARPQASMDEVIAAARGAEAHEFIRALPQGYATPLGERGARLSGGQVQRIAIARALLKGAPLLVLDEMTAYLDPQSEAAVQAALRRLLAGRTALIIAHRLQTVRDADRIVVVEGGRAVETGTHAALLAQGSVYPALVAAQQSLQGGAL